MANNVENTQEEVPAGYVKTKSGNIIPVERRAFLMRDHKTVDGRHLKINLEGKAYERRNGGLVSLDPKKKLTKRQKKDLTKARGAFRDGELDRLKNIPYSQSQFLNDDARMRWYLNGWFSVDVSLTLEMS